MFDCVILKKQNDLSDGFCLGRVTSFTTTTFEKEPNVIIIHSVKLYYESWGYVNQFYMEVIFLYRFSMFHLYISYGRLFPSIISPISPNIKHLRQIIIIQF